MASPADRNLLFGILALQMDFIGRDALIAAMNSWTLAKHQPLGDILVEQGALTPDVVSELDAIVNRHVQMHRGDTAHSLAALTAIDARSILAQVADPEVQHSLRQVPGSHGTNEDSGRAATVAQPTREPEDAGRPPRFTILRPHAKGGLGEVFIAHDDELNREVALKEIQVREDRKPDSRRRFIMEAEITGRLEHPGIVPVYGLGSYSDGRPYYAMRFVEGQGLREAIKDFHEGDQAKGDSGARRVAFRELLGRFVAVCNAIAFAHSKGVLHRDLKPENVMLGKYGETLVVDWGLAKPIGRAEHQTPSDVSLIQPQSGSGVTPTQMGSAVGTPAYMSPEQASGRLDRLGPTSDIYSLGATLYTLLTGKKSVDGDLVDVLRKVQRGEIVPPRQLNPSTPDPRDAICRKAMSLNPEDRYASALDLAQDVELWLSDEPVFAWREPPRVRASRWLRKHRTLVTTALATLVVAVVGLLAVAAVQSKSGRELAAKNRELEDSNARLAESRDRAERRFDLAVGAIENFRSAVDGNLDVKNRPENEGLRKTLLQAPLAFYQKVRDDLSAADDAQPEGRAKLADAYFNLATIDREIGSQADALKAYDATVALLEPLWQTAESGRKSELRARLARVLYERGRLQLDSQNLMPRAQESLNRARELREAALHDKPDDIEMRVNLAETLGALALLENRKGDVDGALATLRQSMSLLEEGRRAGEFARQSAARPRARANERGPRDVEKPDSRIAGRGRGRFKDRGAAGAG
jgi:eukaryotic-like serine/threonine-protein kinase